MKHLSRIILAVIVAGSGLWFLASAASNQTAQDPEVQFQRAVQLETIQGDLNAAIDLYKQIIKNNGNNRAVAAKALLRLGGCYEKLGPEEARKTYQQLVNEYADQQQEVNLARQRLAALAGAGGAPGGSTLTTRRVSSGLDVTGQVLPDGRFLSFTDWGTGGDLAIHDLATGQNRRLTDRRSLPAGLGGFAEYSIPSPDGKSVAYAWNGNTYDLCVIGLDGSKPRVLQTAGDGVVTQFPLVWLPDGRRLLAEFVKVDGSRDMKLVTVADGSTKLLKAVGRDLSPGGVFSPDGRYIAWATKEGLSLFELETGIESLLIPDRSNHSVLGWTPDGKHILFSSDRSGSAAAWLIAVAGGKAQGDPKFVRKDWGSGPMGFTRSGAFYYYVNNNAGDVQIAELDPAGGNLVSPPQWASRRGNTRAPDWSPDGRFLAFISSRDPSRAVIVSSMETGEERVLRIGEWTIAEYGALRWTPDGKAVAVTASEPGKGEHLIRLDVQTGQVTTLMPLPGAYGFTPFEFSLDGNRIYYVNRKGERLVVHDLRSGRETEILKKLGLLSVAVSPDGQQLLLVVAEGNSQVLLVMPAAGGEARELVRVDGKREVPFWGSPTWAADGRHVLFMKGIAGKARQWQLWRMAVDSGEPQQLGLTVVGQLLAGPRLHPDGRRLAISTHKANLEVWVMENFLPPPEVSK